jgi:hypothetical protein
MLRSDRHPETDLPCGALLRKSANGSQLQESVMIVLTTGPDSLVRLMRRDEPSQHLAPRQVDGHQDQGDQAQTAPQPQRRMQPPSL